MSLGVELARYILPLIGSGALAGADKEAGAMQALAGAMSSLSGDDAIALMERCIVGNVQKDGKSITNLDMAFDSPVTMFKVARFMVELNFMDFFKGMSST